MDPYPLILFLQVPKWRTSPKLLNGLVFLLTLTYRTAKANQIVRELGSGVQTMLAGPARSWVDSGRQSEV